jgi:hypothetical protein
MMEIVNEACIQLDKFDEFPGKSSLEKSTKHILSMFNLALSKQPKLLKAVAAASNGQMATSLAGLDKLFFNINPSTGHMDHPTNIIKYDLPANFY